MPPNRIPLCHLQPAKTPFLLLVKPKSLIVPTAVRCRVMSHGDHVESSRPDEDGGEQREEADGRAGAGERVGLARRALDGR